jgi:hypothetical protein
MKAEKFLEQLGLSVNIVIVILLLVIVYYLYCINDNLSMERFSVGGQQSRQARKQAAEIMGGVTSVGHGGTATISGVFQSASKARNRGKDPRALNIDAQESVRAQMQQADANNRARMNKQRRAGCPDGQVRGPNGLCMTREQIMAAGRAELNRQGINGGGVQTNGPGLGQSTAAVKAGNR